LGMVSSCDQDMRDSTMSVGLGEPVRREPGQNPHGIAGRIA